MMMTPQPNPPNKKNPIRATDNPKPRLRRRRWLAEERVTPCLTFSPRAWLKLQFFLHAGDTEVGGFGVGSPHDPLYITDFLTVRQYVTPVTVEFDDQAVADHFDRCVDQGLQPAQFARIWLHTHPGKSPEPSGVDEETFTRVFGGCEWAMMFIIGRTGLTYARLQFFAGPGGQILLPVKVDWEAWPQLVLEQAENLSQTMSACATEFTQNVILALPAFAEWTGKATTDKTTTERFPRPGVRQENWEESLDALYEAGWSEQQIVEAFEYSGAESEWEAQRAMEVRA